MEGEQTHFLLKSLDEYIENCKSNPSAVDGEIDTFEIIRESVCRPLRNKRNYFTVEVTRRLCGGQSDGTALAIDRFYCLLKSVGLDDAYSKHIKDGRESWFLAGRLYASQ